MQAPVGEENCIHWRPLEQVISESFDRPEPRWNLPSRQGRAQSSTANKERKWQISKFVLLMESMSWADLSVEGLWKCFAGPGQLTSLSGTVREFTANMGCDESVGVMVDAVIRNSHQALPSSYSPSTDQNEPFGARVADSSCLRIAPSTRYKVRAAPAC